MIGRYFHQLREAVVERRLAQLPLVLPIIVAVSCCTLVYILVALFLISSDKPIEYHFVNEDGAVTVLSSLYLAAASAFSLATLATLIRVNDPSRWVWFVLACGFGFLAFDELLQFHDRVGEKLDQIGGAGPFRSWNDIIVILYGVVALPIFIGIVPGLVRCRMVLEMFAAAFVLYGIHTCIDSMFEPPTSVSIIMEESAKLFCGAFLATGAFIGFIGTVWSNIKFDPAQLPSVGDT